MSAVAVYLDDRGHVGAFRTVTKEQLEALNERIQEQGSDEFGRWFWIHELSSVEGHA